MNIRDKQILQIALPSIVSNLTVPLLGLIDVAIVGHMGSAVYIGAVAVGSMTFNLIYWLFSFLRMGSSGLTSQALGGRDLNEVVRQLVRSLTIAMTIAMLLLLFQVPIRWLVFLLIGPTPDVAPYAITYYNIVIWGAPASLSLFCLTGWFIGMQNTRIPMVVSILQNLINIVVSLTLVYGFGMKIEGVASGTVIAQYTGLLIALVSLLYYRRLWKHLQLRGTFVRTAMSRFFHVNRDIFLRTLCLVAVNFYFTSAGARHGAIILSVNTILLQLFLFYSYFMDGFAYAGEALGGRSYGAGNGQAFREMLHRLFGWATGVTLAFTLFYLVGGSWLISILTDEQQVITTSADYLWWIWLIPVVSTLAFIWDGVFIGMTATKGMLVSSFLSALLFFIIYESTRGKLGNHGLWLAMIIYLAGRGTIQTWWYKTKLAIKIGTH